MPFTWSKISITTNTSKMITHKNDKITKIVINSHKNNKIALEKLLETIGQSNLNIIVCIGGFYDYNDYKITEDNNITYIYCNHNSIDFTGLITLLELFPNSDDTYIYIHDTCSVGKEFNNIISNISIEQAESVKINQHRSMNMGIYTSNIIRNNSNFLLKMKNNIEENTQLFKSMAVTHEDYIFNHDPTNICLYPNNREVSGPEDVYNTGVLRIIEYYSALDLYKYKANWFGKQIYELNI